MKTTYKIIATALLSGTAILATAQTADTTRGPAPFSAYDLNQDNAITEQELTAFRDQRRANQAQSGKALRNAANASSFSEIDLNGDRVISQNELATHQQQMMQQRSTRPNGQPAMAGQGRGPGMGRGMGRNMPAFTDFDLNNDGVMTEDEFVEARGQRIANRAKQGYMMRGLQNMQSFDTIDLNQDGIVNPAEFSQIQMQHRQSRLK